jgi:hypothetical protein
MLGLVSPKYDAATKVISAQTERQGDAVPARLMLDGY